jgi:hypothetical protein
LVLRQILPDVSYPTIAEGPAAMLLIEKIEAIETRVHDAPLSKLYTTALSPATKNPFNADE